MSNLRQIGLAGFMYIQDFDGYVYPRYDDAQPAGRKQWQQILYRLNYVSTTVVGATTSSVFLCPTARGTIYPPYQYGVNNRIAPTATGSYIQHHSIKSPHTKLWVTDGQFYFIANTPANRYPHPRHDSGINILFVEGHVEWLQWEGRLPVGVVDDQTNRRLWWHPNW